MCLVVTFLHQQPVMAWLPRALARIITHPDERPTAMHPFALELEFDHTLFKIPLRVVAFWFPCAAIPQLDCAAAILSLRNRAFECSVFQRMIFDFDRQPLCRRIERWNLGNRPGFVDAIEFKPQVEMQPGRGMALNNEAQTRRLALRDTTTRFGSDAEIAFRAVCLQSCHS